VSRRSVHRFVCQACGAVWPKWSGKCEACNEWNTIVEEAVEPTHVASKKASKSGRLTFTGLDGQAEPPPRVKTGLGELDRVLGGGLVPSSVILVGGDPGIGKSTLLLQTACRLGAGGQRVIYISGEESVDQIRLRARRLGLAVPGIEIAASINVADIISTLSSENDVRLVVIDSIQTMWLETVDSAPGSVAQVRACSFELIRLAKKRGFALVLVGHVTKDGALAGPRVMEHMVDAVMYFEGDRGHQFRILRAAKNRFGATDEIGVFAMTEQGLSEVPNPSALFLAERRGNIAGSAVFAGLEGSRPVLLEVQALLAPKAGDGGARRSVLGWDSGRLMMLLAVLEARCGLKLSGMDVYLNFAGGLKVTEPAADLAVAAALVSAMAGRPTSAGTVYFGEIGLSGEVRQVPQPDLRLREAGKLGFSSAVLPKQIRQVTGATLRPPEGLQLREIGHLTELTGPMTEDMDAE
jgi:DNA repair protein RadA/Sms